jgi:hypothetical protein
MDLVRLVDWAPAWLTAEVFILTVAVIGIVLVTVAYTLGILRRRPGHLGAAADRAFKIGALTWAMLAIISGIGVIVASIVAQHSSLPSAGAMLGGAVIAGSGLGGVLRWRRLRRMEVRLRCGTNPFNERRTQSV